MSSPILVPENKIIVPPTRGYRCGYCPNLIFAANESNGRLHTTKDGKPICVRCRVLHGSKMKNQIRADKGKYEKDVKLRDALAQKRENERVAEIAQATQDRSPESKISK